MFKKIIKMIYIYKLNKFYDNYDFYTSIAKKCDYILKKSKIKNTNIDLDNFEYIFITYTIHILTNSKLKGNYKIGIFLQIELSDLLFDNIELFREDIENLRYLNSLKFSLDKF